jgi:hypothetical protein
MCIGNDPPEPDPPATPPPPPPVLEQEAPKTIAPKTADQLQRRADGTKKYRSPLSINSGSGTDNTGLSITS